MVSHKDVLLALVGLALVSIALSGLANASELRASYSSISFGASRAASVFVYVTNDDYESKTVSFSASSLSGNLELYYDYYDSSLGPKGSRGATLRVSAAENTRGCDSITVEATVCSADGGGACETLSRVIRASISPSRESRYYIENPVNYCVDYATRVEPRGSRVASSLEFTGYFDPTEYDARFVDALGVNSCAKIKPGQFARFPVSLRNVGAATSYEIRLIGDKDVLNAALSNSYVSLQRNEIAEFSVSVAPTHYASAGRYYVEVQAQRNGVTVASRDVCVEVEHSYGVRLSAPAAVEASTCGVTAFDAQLENTGSGKDIFGVEVSDPDWALVETQDVEARGGQKQVFSVRIDGTRLQPGAYRLGIKASSGQNPDAREVYDKAFVSVLVKSCVPKTPLAPAQSSVKTEAQDEVVRLLVNIENPGDAPIDNVSVALDGLPEKWSYVSEAGFTVPAHANKTLTVLVKRTTDEEAKNVLVKIKSGDKVVGVQEIPKIESRASGLTGFFVAAGGNTWIIALIIIVALAVVVLSGRLRVGGGEDEQNEIYAQRLRSLKKQVDASAPALESGKSEGGQGVDGVNDVNEPAGSGSAFGKKNGKDRQPVAAS